MQYFEEFRYTGQSYESRAGEEPEAVTSAVGRVALAFAWLDDSVGAAVAKILELKPPASEILPAELSFRQKVDLMVALLREGTGRSLLDWGDVDDNKLLSELATICNTAAQLRNRVMHSSWDSQYWGAESLTRRKVTAKSRGLRVAEEDMDGSRLMDIADYIAYCGIEMMDLFDLRWD